MRILVSEPTARDPTFDQFDSVSRVLKYSYPCDQSPCASAASPRSLFVFKRGQDSNCARSFLRFVAPITNMAELFVFSLSVYCASEARGRLF